MTTLLAYDGDPADEIARLRADRNALQSEMDQVRAENERLRHSAFVASRVALTGRMPKAYSDDDLVKMFGPYWERRDVGGLSPREVALLETIIDRNLSIASRHVTCAFCGHEFPDGTAKTQDERLAAHVRVCEKHPLNVEIARLRAELEEARGIVGTLTPQKISDHPNEFEDGDTYLLFVPVRDRFGEHHEMHIVTVSCDSETPVSFRDQYGEIWDVWTWEDAEFYIKNPARAFLAKHGGGA